MIYNIEIFLLMSSGPICSYKNDYDQNIEKDVYLSFHKPIQEH